MQEYAHKGQATAVGETDDPRPWQGPLLAEERRLEALTLLDAGAVLAGTADAPVLVHVDAVRLRRNRRLGTDEPILRLLHGGQTIHARQVEWTARTVLGEDYTHPAPGRPGAVAVVKVYGPVTILR